jgi:hypothetical protein
VNPTTSEISGIAPALGIPIVYARKTKWQIVFGQPLTDCAVPGHADAADGPAGYLRPHRALRFTFC